MRTIFINILTTWTYFFTYLFYEVMLRGERRAGSFCEVVKGRWVNRLCSACVCVCVCVPDERWCAAPWNNDAANTSLQRAHWGTRGSSARPRKLSHWRALHSLRHTVGVLIPWLLRRLLKLWENCPVQVEYGKTLMVWPTSEKWRCMANFDPYWFWLLNLAVVENLGIMILSGVAANIDWLLCLAHELCKVLWWIFYDFQKTNVSGAIDE